MAFLPHTYVVFQGTWTFVDAPQETWLFGIRGGNPPGDWSPLADPAAWLAAIGPSLFTWWASAAAQMSTKAQLQSIKANNIKADGHYADPTTNVYGPGPQLGAATGTNPIPVTCAITWGTGRSSGRARHGRIYPPLATTLFTNSGASVSITSAGQYVTAGKGLLTALSTPAASQTFTPGVFSNIDGSANLIKQVSCDTRLDLQRRRTRQIVGTRSSSAWP